MSVIPERIGALETRAREANIPVNALVELTHRCNLRCFHCYVDPDRRQEMTTREVEATLDQLADAGTLFVTFTGGEILLRRDLFEIVEHARSRHFAVRLFTNGTLLKEEQADTIAALDPVDVSISMYGSHAATHESVTRVTGSFERSLNAFRLLQQRGVATRLKCVLMQENADDREAIGELARSVGATPQFDPQLTPRNDGDASAISHRLDDDRLREVIASDDKVHEGDVPMDIALCSAARDSVSISPSGIVNPCVQMPYPLGDLRKRSFDDIWRGARATQLRTITLSRIRACATCSDVQFCNPCIGLNYVESGDISRPSSSVCRMAHARRKGVMT